MKHNKASRWTAALWCASLHLSHNMLFTHTRVASGFCRTDLPALIMMHISLCGYASGLSCSWQSRRRVDVVRSRCCGGPPGAPAASPKLVVDVSSWKGTCDEDKPAWTCLLFVKSASRLLLFFGMVLYLKFKSDSKLCFYYKIKYIYNKSKQGSFFCFCWKS